MPVLTFLSSTAGRWTRGIAGAGLIVAGLVLGGAGYALAGVGVVFVLVGVFDVCLLAPLFRRPLSGARYRAMTNA